MKYFNNFSKSQALGMCLIKASIDTFSSFPMAFQKGLKDVFKIVRMPVHSTADSLSFQAWGKADLSGGSKKPAEAEPSGCVAGRGTSQSAGLVVEQADVSPPCLTSPGKCGFLACPCCLLPFPFDRQHEPLWPAHDTNLLHPMS